MKSFYHWRNETVVIVIFRTLHNTKALISIIVMERKETKRKKNMKINGFI